MNPDQGSVWFHAVEGQTPQGTGYNLFLRVADEGEASLYLTEHWFEERPDPETLVALFESAKSTFGLLYPEAEAVDFSVELWRSRPNDAIVKS